MAGVQFLQRVVICNLRGASAAVLSVHQEHSVSCRDLEPRGPSYWQSLRPGQTQNTGMQVGLLSGSTGCTRRQHRLHSETAAGALVTATVSASENLAVGHRWASDGCSILASLLLPIDGTVAGTCAA